MMFEYPTDLLIKQTLRSVVFDSTNMGIMSSRAHQLQSKINTNLTQTIMKESPFCGLLKSPETIKWLFERPNDYMYKIFENETFKDTVETTKDEKELKAIKHRILFAFLKELRDSRPPQAMEWVAFQHYMYFAYRNFLTPRPLTTEESLPSVLVIKMYELVVSLTIEDKAQFYVRIITLLREYVMTARDNYEELSVTADITIYLKCLLSYYSAFCSAASKLCTVLCEFDLFMNERFNINWMCLNQRMFFQYFFMRPSVQCKVSLFNKLLEENETYNEELIKSYNCFVDDMRILDKLWERQRKRISIFNDRNSKDESQWLQKDWKMFEEITKIMKTNFWIIRSNEWKSMQEGNELDGHFLAIVEDTWHVADRLIAPEGNCICEDCMGAEFRQGLITGSIQQPLGSAKLIMCYLCRDIMTLELLGNHVVGKHADVTVSRTDLTKSYKWQSTGQSIKKGLPVKRASTKLCKVLSETVEMAKNKEGHLFKMNDGTFKIKNDIETTKETASKRLLECPVRNNSDAVLNGNENEKKCLLTPEPMLIAQSTSNDIIKVGNSAETDKEPVMKIASEAPVFASNNFSDEMEGCRAAFEEFVKSRTEGADSSKKVEENKKDSKKLAMEKKDKKDCILIDVLVPVNGNLVPQPVIKSQTKTSEPEMFEILKNGNSPKVSTTPLPPSNKSPDNSCTGHVCGHKCKKEEEGQMVGKKQSCQELCDHHKEPKKCDCAYCEVFGSNVAAHSHKVNETRDRLRTRLNQRKEKIGEIIKSNTKIGASPKLVASDLLKVGACCGKTTAAPPKISVTNINSCGKSIMNGSACSHSKTTSCENCGPINIKVLSNITDSKHTPEILCVEHQKQNEQPKILSDRPDLSDIDGLIDFIQGNKPIDRIAIAKKKAAKKARQRLKKEQAKLRREEEEEARKMEERRIREEQRREELRAQALAKQHAEQMKKKKQNKLEREMKQQQQKQELLMKQQQQQAKKKGKNKSQPSKEGESDLMEETIPAMVTIKRIVENNNSPPTVTITLKGSTPDQDKLLYTLVNGHTSDYLTNCNSTADSTGKMSKKKSKKPAKQGKVNDTNEKDKKKKNAFLPNDSNGVVTTKEFKVTLSVDKSFHKGKEAVEYVKKSTKQNEKQKNINSKSKSYNKINEGKRDEVKEIKLSQSKQISKDLDIDIPSLKLPPGITITKVSGPLTNKNSKSSTNSSTSTPTQYQNVPVSKSGVIVVDTEKLIQQSITANANKKNKKKRNKGKLSPDQSGDSMVGSQINNKNSCESKPAMVTLKNPIFHTLQTKFVEKSEIPIIPYNEQASITKGENGMVTIRRPRCLQLPIEKESPMTEFLSELKPVIGPEVSTSYNTSRSLKEEHKPKFAGPNGFLNNIGLENGVCDTSFLHNFKQNGDYKDVSNPFLHNNMSDSNKSGLSAHEILWGLPGIEITKVNKNAISNEADNKKSCQTADVSIIPTGTGMNNGEKFNFDRDDWPFESVFAPKDILEDDLDADERELEAFKRFCQQSVPPKHKEKVAHLNVKDIVLKKKNDVTYS